MKKRRVIIVTDGDEYARKAIEHVAKAVGGRCISRSYGNPTTLTGSQTVDLILQAPYDPVFVMFDDSGFLEEGPGGNCFAPCSKASSSRSSWSDRCCVTYSSKRMDKSGCNHRSFWRNIALRRG